MKKNLILHIFMGKTGTSALQEFLGANRTLLEKTDDATQSMAQ